MAARSQYQLSGKSVPSTTQFTSGVLLRRKEARRRWLIGITAAFVLVVTLYVGRTLRWTSEQIVHSCKVPAVTLQQDLQQGRETNNLGVSLHIVTESRCAFLVDKTYGSGVQDYAYVVDDKGVPGPVFSEIVKGSIGIVNDQVAYIGQQKRTNLCGESPILSYYLNDVFQYLGPKYPDNYIYSQEFKDMQTKRYQDRLTDREKCLKENGPDKFTEPGFQIIVDQQPVGPLYASLDGALASDKGSLFNGQRAKFPNTAFDGLVQGYSTGQLIDTAATKIVGVTQEAEDKKRTLKTCWLSLYGCNTKTWLAWGLPPHAIYEDVLAPVLSANKRHLAFVINASLQSGHLTVNVDQSNGADRGYSWVSGLSFNKESNIFEYQACTNSRCDFVRRQVRF